MDGISLFHVETWKPLSYFGYTNSLFELNSETIIYSWIALIFLTILCIAARYSLRKPESIGGYITIKTIENLTSQIKQTFGIMVPRYFFFIGTLFGFIFICNLVVLIPWMEEPTKDINTTFAFGLISFLYTQKEMFRAHGLAGYISHYCKIPFKLFPKGFSIGALPSAFLRAILNTLAAILSFPMEALGKIASLVSLSLRLFGNIFGGSIIGSLLKKAISGSSLLQILALISGVNLVIALFFGLFEAFIQAFVFSVLSMTYIGMATHATKE